MAILAKTQKRHEGKSERGGGGLHKPPLPPLLRERVNVPVHGRCGEEGLPKFNPRSGRGLNPEPLGWQSETLPVVLTSQISNHCSH